MTKTGSTTTAIAAAIAIAIAAAFTACDDEAAGITKEEFVSRSNAICAANAEQADAIFDEVLGSAPKTSENAQKFLERLLPVFRGGVEQRSEIPAPEGDEATVEAINTAGDEATVGFEEAVETPEASAALMRGQTPDPALEYDQLSEDYGADGCAGDE